jgi:hypothetical protein
MANPAELYVNGVRKKMQLYYAAWLPNEVLCLGDVGTLEKGTFFRHKTSLDILGIKFSIREDPSPTPFDMQSEKGVQLANKLAGEVNLKAPSIPQAKAGVAIDFSAKGAFVIRAPLTYEPVIEDIATLETQILDLYKKGRWNKEWVVMAKLVSAPSATILISRSSEGKIELSAEAQLAAGTGVQLGEANLKLNVSFVSGDIINMKDAQNVTPFFQLIGLKRRWFQEDKVKSHRVDGLSGDPLDEITPAMVSENEKVAKSLYLDVIWEPVTTTED